MGLALPHALMPFDAPSEEVRRLGADHLVQMYLDKCGMDVRPFLRGHDPLVLYRCSDTGMMFWRPTDIAGDERFYRELSAKWPAYYREDRWEYASARSHIGTAPRSVIEIGCGRGYFLRSLESAGHSALGLELNSEAARNKVTRFPVLDRDLASMASQCAEQFDVVCSFQVLEHVVDPAGFLRDCIRLARPGGLILLSTPDHDFALHKQGRDAFDLPPHHLNHFTTDTYRRIARRLGLELVGLDVQQLKQPRVGLPAAPADAPAWQRLLRRRLNGVLRLLFGKRTEPGHTMLAVLRRPQRGPA